ncbi:MtnX-like HAD-IB family phosphatase [Rhizobium sp. 768_B6_N1_8]|jgi:2,3-diketo-5-methylthio-1-phosphopentane phosphatase|uniref:MtnX-like HAD-IB family phosphatase n=1 Tax=unclassified Rhizobium TaxID=2613769 RepID=UPI003F26EF09
MQVFCDFDGTISKEDVTDLVLDRFARPEWREIEDQWTNGRITAAQCMRRQIQLLQAKHEDIDAFLDTIEIDSAFGAFKAFCEENGLSLTIVSDGVDHFIRRVLARHGLEDIQIIANKLISRPHACTMPDFDLGFPFKSAACAAGAGVCKCAQVRPSGNHIYIGDGRSDFCVSHEAQLVFAKAKLAEYCRANCLPFIPYSGFAEIQASVAAILSSPSRQPVALPVAKTA